MSTSKVLSKAKALAAKFSGSEPMSEEKWLREAMKAAEAQSGYVAIYIVAPVSQSWPVAFGICSDPVAAYHSYQKGWWEEHGLQAVLWTPGKPAAERIKRRMVERLEDKRKFFSRSWYDASAEEVLKVLIQSAKEEGVPLFDEVERQRRFATAARIQREELEGVVRSRVPEIPKPRTTAAILPLRPAAEARTYAQKAR